MSTSYTTFFSRATGVPPFPYQSALAESATLPDRLTVPTGCGKTAAVVLGWLWRRRAAPPELRSTTPRRLVYTLPVRTLVDQTLRDCRRWVESLGLDVPVHGLLGGAVSHGWDLAPERDTILVGTLDQLLSRALLRGYAMSRFRWPIHFAQLHNDAWWVFDETQLMGPALSTSAQLEAFRRDLGTALPTRSTWMSATNAPGRLQTVDLRRHALTGLELGEADRAHPELAVRLGARKGLERVKVGSDVAGLAWERHVPGTRTLVIVNRVARAVEVCQALEKRRTKAKSAVALRLVHSRFRPGDRRSQQDDALLPGFDGIVVATQAVEAGVDISARTLVSDLAPWASLIQRFGRCNRRGEFAAGEASVVVVDLADKDAAPYSPEALADARARLDGLAEVGPDALAATPAAEERPALPVIRRKDLLDLFDTEPDLSGRHLDVARYLREADDRDVQIAWRELGKDGPAADAPALHQDELCRVGIGPARKLLKDARVWRWEAQHDAWEVVPRGKEGPRIVPGDVVLVAKEVGGYSSVLGFTGSASDRPAPVDVPTPPEEKVDDDPLTLRYGSFLTLRQHSDDVVAALNALAAALGEGPWETLTTAARWHDLGKVHPAFQALLLASLAGDDPRRGGGPWAKSDGVRAARPPQARPGFRHELASALAWLHAGGDDLTAYLVAAHHGKVRMRMRSRPGERPLPDRPDVPLVLGVRTGDELPATDLGGGVVAPAATLSTELAALGAEGGSWADRALRLVENHGPFRLAWWEAIVRIADWRASQLRSSNLPEAS